MLLTEKLEGNIRSWIVSWFYISTFIESTIPFPGQLTRVVEYANCISAEGKTTPPTQQVSWIGQLNLWWWSPTLKVLGNVEYPLIAITPRSTLTQRSSYGSSITVKSFSVLETISTNGQLFAYKSYISNICIIRDLVLNNRQGLICRKTQPIN